jgi:hypothetical protein
MSQPDHMELNDFQHFIANQDPNKSTILDIRLNYTVYFIRIGLSTVCSFPDNSTKDDAIS